MQKREGPAACAASCDGAREECAVGKGASVPEPTAPSEGVPNKGQAPPAARLPSGHAGRGSGCRRATGARRSMLCKGLMYRRV